MRRFLLEQAVTRYKSYCIVTFSHRSAKFSDPEAVCGVCYGKTVSWSIDKAGIGWIAPTSLLHKVRMMTSRILVVGSDNPVLHTVALIIANAGFDVEEVAAEPGTPLASEIRVLWDPHTDDRSAVQGLGSKTKEMLWDTSVQPAVSWSDVPESAVLAGRYRTLTPREREIAGLVVRGMMNKEVAGLLNISERTVKLHRARVMTKLQARSLPDLVRYLDRIEMCEQQKKQCQSAPRPLYAVARQQRGLVRVVG